MVRTAGCLILLVVAFGALGCGGGVQEKQIEIKAASDPLLAPRSILQRYAEGQALGSEVTSFAKLVEDVKAVDPAKAEILDKGLQELQQASPSEVSGKAKKLLQQL